MGLEVKLTLDKLGEEVLKVCHSSELVGVEAGIGGRSLFNQSEMKGPECAAVSEREVWPGVQQEGNGGGQGGLGF